MMIGKRLFGGCGHAFSVSQDSKAHIIPSALGGRLKPRGLLCRDCNGKLDKLADLPLINSLGFFTTFLGIERDRGENPSLLWRAPDGTEYWIDEDGKPSYRGAVVSEKKVGDATLLSIAAPNLTMLKHKLRELKRQYPAIDPTALLQEGTRNSRRIQEYLRHGLQLGPATTFPGILVMLWLFYLHKTGVPFCLCETMLNELQSPATLDMFFYIPAPETWLIGPEIVVAHRLVLKSDERGTLFGYADLFGAIRVGGVLARHYTNEIEHVYVYDLLQKQERSAEFRIGDAFLSLNLERPGLAFSNVDAEAEAVMTEIKVRMGHIIPVGLKRIRENERDRLIEAFLKKLADSGADISVQKATVREFSEAIARLIVGNY